VPSARAVTMSSWFWTVKSRIERLSVAAEAQSCSTKRSLLSSTRICHRMARRKTDWAGSRVPAIIGAAVVIGALGAVAPVTAAAAPPGNDDYLNSAGLNSPGSRLDRTHTLQDPGRDTTGATVQSDLFNPPKSGGLPEITSFAQCRNTTGATSYGHTVWYDFYPDVSGLVRLRASGYDAVISVFEFNAKTGRPDYDHRQCINASNSSDEELFATVRGKHSYTVQIGGAGDASGLLAFRFDFLADADLDGVLDSNDQCPKLKAKTKSGCPPRLAADVTLRASPTSEGIQLIAVDVSAPRGARVEVRCPGCRTQAKTARTVHFPGLRGMRLRAGNKLKIFVTKPGAIGAYIQYRILAGNFVKSKRCLNPGSKQPRTRCG
jgi:hypothetical protein